eukprot:evm.model.scf_179.10 EVM.evm.TU.scf_179.10   scf_179:99938-104682(+)
MKALGAGSPRSAAPRAALYQWRVGGVARQPTDRAAGTLSNGLGCPGQASSGATGEEIWQAVRRLYPQFLEIDQLVASNSRRVQEAYSQAKIGRHHFAGSTGYGYGDLGRKAFDEAMADVMGAESAIVRSQFVSGTHAIACGLYGALRPGDELLSVTGRPYDTLEEVIGLRGSPGSGSLREWGVSYRELDLTHEGKIDWEALPEAIAEGRPRVAFLQRSCGYALRSTLTIAEIERAVQVIKGADPGCLVFVDNCYGEFTEKIEPPSVGADLAMGSLIKNPGGTLAPGGGYVAGRADMVEAAFSRLGAPGVGLDAGSTLGEYLRLVMQGLFLAPQFVGEALKAGRLIADVMGSRGYGVTPGPGMHHEPSFITAVELGSPDKMAHFCKAVQACCPVASYVQPVPGVTAGYGDEVIFADGTFIDGSTSELSADGPLRPPYVVYCQGGTHWTHWALALEAVIQKL